MNRHTIALAGAATAVLMSAAALATAAGDAPTTIEACRNTRHGLVRIVFSAERLQEQRDARLVGRRGPGGPGRPCRARQGLPARREIPERGSARSTGSPGTACKTFDGATGHVEVGSTATDLITLTCETGGAAAAAAPGNARLVINEVDYDQVGADTGGFVEIANTGTAAATLDGTALVLVNGGDGTEYGRKTLTGHARGRSEARRRRRSAERRARRPRARRHDEGHAARRAQLRGCDPHGHDRHQDLRPRRGNVLPVDVADSNTVDGTLARIPDGTDANNAAADWVVHDDADAGSGEREDAVAAHRAWRRAFAAIAATRWLGLSSPSSACSPGPRR